MRKRRWTKEEEDFLRRYYATVPARNIGVLLGRSKKSVIHKARGLGLLAVSRPLSYPRKIKEYLPSPDLAYIIGAVKGDGWITLHRQKSGETHYSLAYIVGLVTKDYEFAEQFRKSICNVTGRMPKIMLLCQHRSSANPNGEIFRVVISDKSLFHLLSRPFEELKRYIEPYPTYFLRGFFDAEGSAWTVKRRNRSSEEFVVKFCNTDKGLLEYVRELLIRLKIYPAPKMFGTMGNLGVNRKKCYNLVIYRKNSVKRFMEVVGSSISRKRLVIS